MLINLNKFVVKIFRIIKKKNKNLNIINKTYFKRSELVRLENYKLKDLLDLRDLVLD